MNPTTDRLRYDYRKGKRVPIGALTVPERALQKLAGRSIEQWEAHEVLFNRNVLLRNKRNRAASHRLVGRTDAGRLLTLLVRPTDDAGVWEVVNGWQASSGERALFERSGS